MIPLAKLLSLYDDDYQDMPAQQQQGVTPRTNIRETEKSFLLEMDLPGFKKEQIDIEITNNTISVSGKREINKCGEKEKMYLCERQENNFARSFKLPKNIQQGEVKASYTDGVLYLMIPKVIDEAPEKVKVAVM